MDPSGIISTHAICDTTIGSFTSAERRNDSELEYSETSTTNDSSVLAATSSLIEVTAQLVAADEDLSYSLTSSRKATLELSPPSIRSIHTEVPVQRLSAAATAGDYLPSFKDQVRDCEPPLISSRHIQTETVDSHKSHAQNIASTAALNRSATNRIDQNSPAPNALNFLRETHCPKGLAQQLAKTKDTYPLRFWYLDNSASMYKADGRRVVQSTDTANNACVIQCTRWSELQESVTYHINFASAFGATTIFHLLNSRNIKKTPKFVVNNEQDANIAKELLLNTRPDGVSLLTQSVLAIHDQVVEMKDTLVNNGQKVVVVLATDGIPSDEYGDSNNTTKQEFAEAIKKLQLLPVWIVVRICSNERSVLNYYRRLDKELERPIDVVGDFLNEAKEVNRLNKWLNYCLPLHRAREMGYSNRLFDLLDERPFTKDEIGEFLEIIYTKEAFAGAPNMHIDWNGFIAFFDNNVLANDSDLHWNPQTQKMEKVIDVRKLKAAFAGGLQQKRDAVMLGMKRLLSKDVI